MLGWLTRNRGRHPATKLNLRWPGIEDGAPASYPKDYSVLALRRERPSVAVRISLAYNQACPPKDFEFLARDSIMVVREHVAANSAAPPDVLAKLAKDVELDVRLAALDNPALPAASFDAARVSEVLQATPDWLEHCDADPAVRDVISALAASFEGSVAELRAMAASVTAAPRST